MKTISEDMEIAYQMVMKRCDELEQECKSALAQGNIEDYQAIKAHIKWTKELADLLINVE